MSPGLAVALCWTEEHPSGQRRGRTEAGLGRRTDLGPDAEAWPWEERPSPARLPRRPSVRHRTCRLRPRTVQRDATDTHQLQTHPRPCPTGPCSSRPSGDRGPTPVARLQGRVRPRRAARQIAVRPQIHRERTHACLVVKALVPRRAARMRICEESDLGLYQRSGLTVRFAGVAELHQPALHELRVVRRSQLPARPHQYLEKEPSEVREVTK